jgi:hypothetical protein
MPCSRNFLTFHMVIRLVGELEIMIMGLVDLAFFAPRDGSEKVVNADPSPMHLIPRSNASQPILAGEQELEDARFDGRRDPPYAGCDAGAACLLPLEENEFRNALIFSTMTLCTHG